MANPLKESKGAGWDKPSWKVMRADPTNNPLIEDVLKPVQNELREVLKMELKDLAKKLRRK